MVTRREAAGVGLVVLGFGAIVASIASGLTAERTALESRILGREREIGVLVGKLPESEIADAREALKVLRPQFYSPPRPYNFDDPEACSQENISGRSLAEKACAILAQEKDTDKVYRARIMQDSYLQELRAARSNKEIPENLALGGGILTVFGGAIFAGSGGRRKTQS